MSASEQLPPQEPNDPKPGSSAEPLDKPKNTPGDAKYATEGGTVTLAVGLLLFGGVLGVVTSLSDHEGISQTLLSSLLTFVGGVLFTFAGMRRTFGDQVLVDTRRIGASLAALSFGVLAGIFGGLLVRGPLSTHGHGESHGAESKARAEGGADSASSSQPAAPPIGTQTKAERAAYVLKSGVREICPRVKGHFRDKFYSSNEAKDAALQDLADLCDVSPDDRNQ